MLAKIINPNLKDYDKEFKVRRMNFNEIIVNYPTGTGLKDFLFKDSQLISENKIDDFLINNRQFLKIKLKRGISVVFYNALKESLESEIKEEIRNLNILKDKYKVNKKGIWEKYILLVANKIFPIEVISSGKNFRKDSYNILISKIDKENFLEVCRQEMITVSKEIEQRNAVLSMLQEVIEAIKKEPEIE